MADKTFTLDEANMLLPVLESLLRQAMEAKETIAEAEKKLQNLGHKIFLTGGLLVDIKRAATRKAEREKAIQQIKDAIAEIHSTGVQVKDLDVGLLDFPCIVDGETVLLCWKYGEPHKIAHWHGVEEGFAGRKPIEMLNLDKKKGKANPEKPN